MNLLEFLEMGVAETLLLSFACFFLVVAFAGIGALFVKRNNRYCLQAVVGISLVAVLVLISVSYCAFLAKYIIFASVGITLLLMLCKLYRKRPSLSSLLESVLPTFAIYACFVALFMSYIFTHDGIVDYNCHMTYTSVIPEEIFRADYSSRLRVTDVYPCEWSKYHLFNGSLSAIPLSVFPFKNIVTFNLAKYAIISLLIGAIYEGLRHRYGIKKSLQMFVVIAFIFTVGANRFTLWTLFINNYSSFLLMGILWISMEDEDYSVATMLSIILSVSTSKSTITGIIFFAYSLYRLLQRNNGSIRKMLFSERTIACYSLVCGIGCIVMVVSGDSPAKEEFLKPGFIANAIESSWISFFFFGEQLNAMIDGKSLLGTGYTFVIPILYVVALFTQRKKIKEFVLRHLKLLFYSMVLMVALYVMYWMQANDGSLMFSRRIVVIPLIFVFLYILPVACIFSCCEKNLYVPLQLFLVFAFVQLMILNADNGVCNYCLMMLPLSYYIADVVVSLLNRIPRKASVAFLVIVFCSTSYYAFTHDIYSIFVWTKSDGHYRELQLQPIDYLGEIPYEYYGPDDGNAVMLNSLKGNRIHYNVVPNQHDPALSGLSMSMRFISESDYENYGVE